MKKKFKNLSHIEALQILDDPVIKEEVLLQLLDANIDSDISKAIIMDDRVKISNFLEKPNTLTAGTVELNIYNNNNNRKLLQERLKSKNLTEADKNYLENNFEIKNAITKIVSNVELTDEEKKSLDNKNILETCQSIASNENILNQLGINKNDVSKVLEDLNSSDKQLSKDDLMGMLYNNYSDDINKAIIMDERIPISDFFNDNNNIKLMGLNSALVYDTVEERIKKEGITSDDIKAFSTHSSYLTTLMQEYVEHINNNDPALEDTLQELEGLHFTGCAMELLKNEDLRKELKLGRISKAEREGIKDSEIEEIKNEAKNLYEDAKIEYKELFLLKAEINRHMENVCKELDSIGGLDVEIESYRTNIKRGFERDLAEIDTKISALDKKYAEEIKSEMKIVIEAQEKLDRGEDIDIDKLNTPILTSIYESQNKSRQYYNDNSEKNSFNQRKELLNKLKIVGKERCKETNRRFVIAEIAKEKALAVLQKTKEIATNVGKTISKEKAKDDLADKKADLNAVKETRETLQQIKFDAIKEIKAHIKETAKHKREAIISRFHNTKESVKNKVETTKESVKKKFEINKAMFAIRPLQNEKEANIQKVINRQQQIARDQAKIKEIYEKAFNKAERVSNRWNKVRKTFGVEEAEFDRGQTYVTTKDAMRIKALELKCIDNHKEILALNKENNTISMRQLEKLKEKGLENIGIEIQNKNTIYDINSPECEYIKEKKVNFNKPLTAQQIDILVAGLDMGATPEIVSAIANKNLSPEMEAAAFSAVASGIKLSTFDIMLEHNLPAEQIFDRIEDALINQKEAIENNERVENKYKQVMEKASTKDFDDYYKDEQIKTEEIEKTNNKQEKIEPEKTKLEKVNEKIIHSDDELER